MKSVHTKRYYSYHFGSSWDLTDQHLKQLSELFDRPMNTAESVLGGRTGVTISELEGFGSVVVKYYARGGLIRRLVKQRYLKWGKARCQLEYEVMQDVRRFGVNAPEPIAYAYKGKIFYKAWLVTKEIECPQTLAELALSDEGCARSVMGELVDQVSALIGNKILHVDLHPGNVVIDSSGRVFLLDFDKAYTCAQNRNKLRDRYLSRWRRAIIKHGLPEMLSEMMDTGLQKIN